MMRNKKGKYITKEGDKGNKGASVKKIEGTRKLKVYRDRRAGPDEMKRRVKKMR